MDARQGTLSDQSIWELDRASVHYTGRDRLPSPRLPKSMSRLSLSVARRAQSHTSFVMTFKYSAFSLESFRENQSVVSMLFAFQTIYCLRCRA